MTKGTTVDLHINEDKVKRVRRAGYQLPRRGSRCLVCGKDFWTCPHGTVEQQRLIDAVRMLEALQ